MSHTATLIMLLSYSQCFCTTLFTIYLYSSVGVTATILSHTCHHPGPISLKQPEPWSNIGNDNDAQPSTLTPSLCTTHIMTHRCDNAAMEGCRWVHTPIPPYPSLTMSVPRVQVNTITMHCPHLHITNDMTTTTTIQSQHQGQQQHNDNDRTGDNDNMVTMTTCMMMMKQHAQPMLPQSLHRQWGDDNDDGWGGDKEDCDDEEMMTMGGEGTTTGGEEEDEDDTTT